MTAFVGDPSVPLSLIVICEDERVEVADRHADGAGTSRNHSHGPGGGISREGAKTQRSGPTHFATLRRDVLVLGS